MFDSYLLGQAYLLDINRLETETIAELTAPQTRSLYWDWPFILPAGEAPITSQYGGNRDYNNGTLQTYHGGTDYRRFRGDPVMAGLLYSHRHHKIFRYIITLFQ